ncbi:GDSL-type esterase/lipase family protein [Geitlerinema sp. PCC 7407]|uniref:GDSL-type esterase/lipase family protein n=1 Tax=Geitlerinema sp. PCC 7407 TaxID=1173025 RepID=UPI00029FE876|nr:GDSL-type esterase/lipase family protein [Geitlerinema sp. PCC 7407]AFY66813.1 lipolytic protein G-D-S-L family [Geitlerinema sp. PCC 7407]
MRICFVGDSFVNGTGDRSSLGWTGRLCAIAQHRGYDLTHYNLGVRRETSADIRQRWYAEVAVRLPETVDGRLVFSFGVNDTTFENQTFRVEPEASLDNAAAILTQAQKQYPVLMVGPPPVADLSHNHRIVHLSERLAALCAQLQVPFLGVVTPLQQSTAWMQEVATYDGAHPREAGYSTLAQLVNQWPAWQAWFSKT